MLGCFCIQDEDTAQRRSVADALAMQVPQKQSPSPIHDLYLQLCGELGLAASLATLAASTLAVIGRLEEKIRQLHSGTNRSKSIG